MEDDVRAQAMASGMVREAGTRGRSAREMHVKGDDVPRRGMSGITLIGSARFRPQRNIWMLEELGVDYSHVPAFPVRYERDLVDIYLRV